MPLIDFINPLDRLTQFNICLFSDFINGLLLEHKHSLAVDIYILLPVHCHT